MQGPCPVDGVKLVRLCLTIVVILVGQAKPDLGQSTARTAQTDVHGQNQSRFAVSPKIATLTFVVSPNSCVKIRKCCA